MQLLQSKLLAQYKGQTLDTIFSGEKISNDDGHHYYIQKQLPFTTPDRDVSHAALRLTSNLEILPGLGNKTAIRFRHNHIFTLDKIPEDSRFYPEAKKVLREIHQGPFDSLYWRLYNSLGKSHQDLLQMSRLIPIENLVFMDIETMGLGNQPITLIGMGRIQNNTFTLEQFFARDIDEEASMIYAFESKMQPNDFFVTFNGEYFDIPYIKNRSRFHGLRSTIKQPNFDALFFSRRVWQSLPNCKLQTIEKHVFQIDREDDVPGAFCPTFYHRFLKTKEIGTVVPIIKHNQQDIISLAMIFFRLQEIWR
jgi:hypothetical protein